MYFRNAATKVVSGKALVTILQGEAAKVLEIC